MSILASVGSVVSATLPPPVDCSLYNKAAVGFGKLVGNIRGLENFGIWIIAALVAMLVIVAAFPRLRQNFISVVIWTAGIIVAGGIAVAVVSAFDPSSC